MPHGSVAQPPAVPRLTGITRYEDGTPAKNASVVMTDLASGAESPAVFSDGDGRFALAIAGGEYALAAATERGFVWVEKQRITSEPLAITLTTMCDAVSGRVSGFGGGEVLVKFGRHGSNTGDTFVTRVQGSGQFSICLPPSEYTALIAGDMLSSGVGVAVPVQAPLALQGYKTTEVKRAPQVAGIVKHDIDGLVDDIRRANPTLVGLGEGSHGSAEFVTQRAKLTFELAQRAGVELVLLENDAISAFELERYVSGEDVDVVKAIADLKFWTSDTYEFIQFMKDVREYNNRNAAHPIHVWGIDVQNTSRPVSLLVANAALLKLSAAEQELLQAAGPDRGKAVKQFAPERRAALDALLARLAIPAGPSAHDTLLAVAARSLAVQVGYLDGDSDALYDERRDRGMAQLAGFVIERTHAPRACLWAHNDHVSRRVGGTTTMGHRMAGALSERYYAIGFFFLEGSSRAWDAAGEIGVISHHLSSPAVFTVESALLKAAGNPDVAWFPIAGLPAELRKWLDTTRYVRELGAVFFGPDRAMILFDVPASFDGLVVIKTIHDSTPTPTGDRRARKK